jgi:hypothetical protein
MNSTKQSNVAPPLTIQSLLLGCADFSFETGAAFSMEFGSPTLRLGNKKKRFTSNAQSANPTTSTKMVLINGPSPIKDQIYRSFRKAKNRIPQRNRAVFVLSSRCIENLNAEKSLYINASFQPCNRADCLFSFSKEDDGETVFLSLQQNLDNQPRLCEIVPAQKILFEWG